MNKIVCSLVVAAMLFSAALTSCGKDDDKKAKEFTVTFVSNGGSDVQSQKVKEGDKVTKPSPDPTRSGFTFDAWCKDAALTAEWNFNSDMVTADVTLYAKWMQDEQIYLVTEITLIEEDNSETSTKYEYDGQNRITKIDEDILSYNSAGDVVSVTEANGDVTTYTKNGNKITIHSSWWDDYSGTRSEEFELNAQGLLEKYTIHHTYSGGDWYTENYSFEYQGKNVIKLTYSGEEMSIGEYETWLYTGSLTYDDKKSPFYHCKTPQWYMLWRNGFLFCVQNNVNSSNTSDGYASTHEYTYNDAGFPLTMKLTHYEKDEEDFVENYTFKYVNKSADQQAVMNKNTIQAASTRANIGIASSKKDMSRKAFFHGVGKNVEEKRNR